MSMLPRKHLPKTLLIIAPSLYQCSLTAREWGLVPGEIENFRNVTRAIQLRSITPGTPYIGMDMGQWSATPEGRDLYDVVDLMIRTCRIRPLRDDELANYRAYDGVPMRPIAPSPATAPRAAFHAR
ncbi:hypothetical protein [Rhizobium sp. RU36D]|uniref:hypothetical protein n=1 Tax=Rhizobium sp. RU36D TaxID=1907415 RepID=UPI0009D7A9E1|nr:hypothetical protein [Rhizobium sp. RU36D]SMD18565.1 hypothetical protein SAMN05880593_13532 [Rhizobium sp. RU36D]